MVRFGYTLMTEQSGPRELVGYATLGQPLIDLDSGLPTDELVPWLASVVGGEQIGVYGQHVRAVKRRGPTVDLRVTVTRMVGERRAVTGALILFEEFAKDDADRLNSGPGG